MDDPAPEPTLVSFGEVFVSNRTMCPVTRYQIKTTNSGEFMTDTDPTEEEAQNFWIDPNTTNLMI
jgi:hypothetical protein